jgi:large subunit ribosomal protein L10
MLSRAEKGQIIDGIKGDIERAQAVVLTNLIGISANDSVKLRKEVRDAGGKISITRNTLFQKASEGTYCEELFKDLKGPHALAFAFEDAASVAKSIHEANKDHELVTLLGGYLNREALTLDQLKELATLPSRDEMLATLLATFNAPISAFVRVIDAIKESKGGSEEAPVEAEVENKTIEE